VFAPPALLLIVGANHVRCRSPAGEGVGYRTAVLTGAALRHEERFPDVDEVRSASRELVGTIRWRRPPAGADAHDYKYDIPVLHKALATEVGYIGMLGSAAAARPS